MQYRNPSCTHLTPRCTRMLRTMYSILTRSQERLSSALLWRSSSRRKYLFCHQMCSPKPAANQDASFKSTWPWVYHTASRTNHYGNTLKSTTLKLTMIQRQLEFRLCLKTGTEKKEIRTVSSLSKKIGSKSTRNTSRSSGAHALHWRTMRYRWRPLCLVSMNYLAAAAYKLWTSRHTCVMPCITSETTNRYLHFGFTAIKIICKWNYSL